MSLYDSIQTGIPKLGLSNTGQPLHMDYGVISPCSKCINKEQCPRFEDKDAYEKYFEGFGDLMDINNAKKNKLPNPTSVMAAINGWSLISGQGNSIKSRVRTVADITIVSKELTVAQKGLRFLTGQGSSMLEPGKGYNNPIMTEQFAGVVFAFVALARKNIAHEAGGELIFKWDDRTWLGGSVQEINCEPYPIPLLYPYTTAGELTDNFRQRKWVSCIYPGNTVHEGYWVPTSMYDDPTEVLNTMSDTSNVG